MYAFRNLEKRLSDFRRGGFPNEPHIGQHLGFAERRDKTLKQVRADLVGGDLRTDVGEVVVRRAGWKTARSQQPSQVAFAVLAHASETKRTDQHAFLGEVR